MGILKELLLTNNLEGGTPDGQTDRRTNGRIDGRKDGQKKTRMQLYNMAKTTDDDREVEG